MRASSKFIGNEIGASKELVDATLQSLGYIEDTSNGFKLTDLGRSKGGKITESDYPSITFDDEVINELYDLIGRKSYYCENCGRNISGQAIYPPNATEWKCLVCGHVNDLTKLEKR